MPEWREEVRRRLRGAPHGGDREGEILEELAQHLEDRYQELLADGIDEAEAYRIVVGELSSSDLLAEEVRRTPRTRRAELAGSDRGLTGRLCASLWEDVRYSARTLRRSPGFAAVAVLTLALGIGANTAIFSVVNAVLLRPLPYPEPDRLLTMAANQSLLDVADVAAANRSFAAAGAVAGFDLDYTGGGEPIRVDAALVNAALFTALGVPPALGRVISARDDVMGGPRLVVLSNGFWRRSFAGDPRVIGTTMRLGGNGFTVIGVMPAGFALPESNADVFVSMRVAYPEAAQFRGVHFARCYCRLRPGITMAQAQADMAAIDRRLAEQYPSEEKGRQTLLLPLQDRVSGDMRPALLVVFGAVGIVLLIACVNFASLLVARAVSREQEVVLRAALGAGQGRLVTQTLTEAVMLALAGGAAGLGLGWWGIGVLLALKPESLARLSAVGVDRFVLLFTFAISLLTGIIFGLAPCWSVIRQSAGSVRSGRGATASKTARRLRSALVVTELASALTLVTSAGLLGRAFWQVRAVDPGFDPQNVLTMRLQLPQARYEHVPEQTQFRRQVLDGLNALPGVGAAMISEIPLGPDFVFHNCVIDGRPPVAPGDEPEIQTRSVMGDYFRVMKIPLRAGRAFGREDLENSPRTAVLNEAAVRRFFPRGNALGARIRWASETTPIRWFTVVGVVGDVRHFGLNQPDEPALYNLYYQDAQPWKRWMHLVIRTGGDPAAMVRAAKAEVWKADAGIAVTGVSTMTGVMAASLAERRFTMVLLVIFAALALTLSAVGLYGLMSHAVSQRTREIAIRVALGAARQDVVVLVGRYAALLTLAGTVAGLAGAFGFARLLSGMLYGVGPSDLSTFSAAAIVLMLVALVASSVPARRALNVDPAATLRNE